jgi:hypothetical protein
MTSAAFNANELDISTCGARARRRARAMPRTTIQCCRCGYTTDRKSSYTDHITKKKRCAARLSNEIPTGNNYIRHETNAGDSNQSATTVNITVNTTVNASTTIHHHHHTHVHIHPYTAALPDCAHISRAAMQRITLQCAEDGVAAVTNLVALTQFNPDKRENMNIYFTSADEGQGAVLTFYKRPGSSPAWCWVNREVMLGWLVGDHALLISDFAEAHPKLVQPDKARAIDWFRNRVHNNSDARRAVDALATERSSIVKEVHGPLLEQAMQAAIPFESLVRSR